MCVCVCECVLVLCMSEGDFIGYYCSVNVSPPSLISLSYSSECIKMSVYVCAFQQHQQHTKTYANVRNTNSTVRTYADTYKQPYYNRLEKSTRMCDFAHTCIPFLQQIIAFSQWFAANKAKLIPLMWNDFKYNYQKYVSFVKCFTALPNYIFRYCCYNSDDKIR